MKKRALVLGGGGTVGIAWEVGVAAGLLEAGVDLKGASLFVGTSAGSVVGTLLAYGMDPQMMLALQQGGAAPGMKDFRPLDPEGLLTVQTKWRGAAEMTPALRRELGALGLSVKTMPEAEWLAPFAATLGALEQWPERRLLITAVDAYTGDFQIWEQESGVPIHLAVASSCAVPGLFPPVTIKESRYVDGGVRSGTNADLAAGYDTVVVVAPMGGEDHPLGHRQLTREAEALREGGAAVALILPDQEALGAFGPDLMAAAQAGPAALTGMRQGRAMAAQVARTWE